MSTEFIESALIEAYSLGDFGLPTAYENVEFTRTEGEPWAALFIIPNQPSASTLGGEGENEHDGIMQIDINYPYNTGTAEAKSKAGEIIEFFQIGCRFDYAEQEVLITSAGRSQGRLVEKDHRITITVNWYARTRRSL